MKEKILIIDNEKIILKHLVMLLTDEGFQVTGAANGRAGIDIFRSESFDLVITDLRMPETDGLEVLRQIRALDRDAQVIILTGFFTSDNAVKAMEGGAACFLGKPLENLDELLIPIRRSLEKRRLRSKHGREEILLELCSFLASASCFLFAASWLFVAEYQRAIFSCLFYPFSRKKGVLK